MVGPYRGKLPESMIIQMEEQLSGSCTVEIAAFDQFSQFITSEDTARDFDHIIFDTAPTGHTLRMLELPSAWSDFIGDNSHGASCLGPLASLQDKRDMYGRAVANLADGTKTMIFLVAKPEDMPLLEAARSSVELRELGIKNQSLIINGLAESCTDDISRALSARCQEALNNIPANLRGLDTYALPLRSYNIMGLKSLRAFFTEEFHPSSRTSCSPKTRSFSDLAEYIYSSGKKVIFTMGKGGVGKTTIAAAIALSLASKGLRVHLSSTDPAGHLRHVVDESHNITLSRIDEKEELRKYRDEVLNKARETISEDDLAYIEEDLRSPCTQEIAVFRAFAEIVESAEDAVVVIDTAPTGHTLLLLDATLSYHREVRRTKGAIPTSVANLLPRLRDPSHTEVVIVTLPEATPVFEASRLKDDLERAGIENTWWAVNQCLSLVHTDDPILSARAEAEKGWINRVAEIARGNVAAIEWRENATPENIAQTS
jgi:arsenite-transporting ATPase